MHLDLHVSRFDWAGGPAGIGPGVADLAERAEAIGVRTLSFMDHFFQMDWMAPAEDPMLEGYTALGFVAGRTERLRLRLLVTGVTYRHPGLLAKTVTTLDVVSGGRAELGIGAAWYEREHRGLGVPFPPTRRALRAPRGGDPDLPADVERRQRRLRGPALPARRDAVQPDAGEPPAPADPDRRQRRAQDAAARRAVRRRLQHLRRVRRGRAQGRRAAPPLRRRSAATRTRSRSPPCTATCPPDATVDDVVRGAEAFAEVGVSTLVTGAVGDDPAGWLESTFGPAMDRTRRHRAHAVQVTRV